MTIIFLTKKYWNREIGCIETNLQIIFFGQFQILSHDDALVAMMNTTINNRLFRLCEFSM